MIYQILLFFNTNFIEARNYSIKIHIWAGISSNGSAKFALNSPPNSPIEMVWNELKKFIFSQDPKDEEDYQITTFKDLIVKGLIAIITKMIKIM
ncbi:hypothetical protein BpHYR1_034533 [Brachionus plicatilis]|uniref:Tc1-like transposase DDE domain-containing protein n=1 Tax=Brachionus plicatilis TaxID=10195 RepID=A0A3M7QPH8_BRAPC|nr:hypothetical protein BpHYR1_034533 [Brachionus plicatilis]